MNFEKETNLVVGFDCNNNCLFCCEGMNRTAGSKTTKELILDLELAKKRGIERIIFTGGEPTIRKDIISLMQYASNLGFKERFVITNGRMFSNKNFATRMVEAGMTHVLFSLVGHNSKLHDKLTRAPGSFEQLIKGIKNVKEFPQVCVENNTTITKPNLKFLPNIAKLLVKLKVNYFEFIFANPCGNAASNFYEIIPKISDVPTFLHKALDIGIEAGVKVTAESIPFCFMHGYEKYMTELYMASIREKLMPQEEIRDLNISRGNVKSKGEHCHGCKYSNICEGVWSSYAKVFGYSELRPVLGKKITSLGEFKKWVEKK